MVEEIRIRPIGLIKSPLKNEGSAPRQGREGDIEGELIVDECFLEAFKGLAPGQNIVILYWMHRAQRDRLQVHPRGDSSKPLKGVFATRSPHRPNPIAMSVLEILDIKGTTLRVRGLDAIDNTPLIDIKCDL